MKTRQTLMLYRENRHFLNPLHNRHNKIYLFISVIKKNNNLVIINLMKIPVLYKIHRNFCKMNITKAISRRNTCV